MAEEKGRELQKGSRAIAAITIIILVHFQVSAVCELCLHGFSPQREILMGEIGKNRSKRVSELFYNSYPRGKKFYENINQFSKTGELLTREIRVKQGRLKGVVREFKNTRMKNVETFLGIPYAASPVNALRFMPPGSPPSWQGLKIFNMFGPVCPQRPPDLTREPLKTMNTGYYNRLKGLMPFLTNQSEDCLYLNIYAPEQDYKYQTKFPVIVYIHGESFDWNSGNPYDGSVLASYGDVIIVTINFRLGILGFLKPGLSDHTVSNFGLLDQIAALQWIKENIEEFGGDSSMVTLMGHGTGAACINFLMVSPVSMASEGLFHKAILLSGTSLSDWAITHNPLQFTIQVAEALNCPLIEKNEELSNCLRRKRLSEIMSVKISVPEFQTAFGPIIDGSVIPNTPHQLMGVYQNLFARYELLYGITQWETYHILDPVGLVYGMLEEEQNKILKKYMYSRFEALPYFALATTLSEYLNWRKSSFSVKSAAEQHRDLVLDVLSDARFTAPVVQMAQYHSKINQKSYFYVFGHKSSMGEFAGSERSVSGEEIAYVFGSPLLNEETSLSYHKFNRDEQLLSEFILTYFTNFAKSGNPNAPRRVEYLTLGPKEWQEFDVYWPQYDSKNQSYLCLDIPPYIGQSYRAEMTQLWNKILPNLMSNLSKPKLQIPEISLNTLTKASLPKVTSSDVFLNSLNRKPGKERDPRLYGTIRMSPNDYQKDKKAFRTSEEIKDSSTKPLDYSLEEVETNVDISHEHSTWIPYLVSITVCLLLINVLIAITYFIKKKERSRSNDSMELKVDSKNDEEFKEIFLQSEHFHVPKNDTQISFPLGVTVQESGKIRRKRKSFNYATESPLTVKNWIQSEILGKCTKGQKNTQKCISSDIKAQTKKSVFQASKRISEPVNSILKNTHRVCKSIEDLNVLSKKYVEKVSVGIDATPSTRGESVLKQTPIELTKSLDQGILNSDVNTVTRNSEEQPKFIRRSRTSISLQILPTDEKEFKFITSTEPEIIKLLPKTSVTENNFVTFLSKNTKDINVTSRDSEVALEGTHADPLENIQKRNFPKVLPDFPDFKAMKRLSFPQATLLNIVESNQNKLHTPATPQQQPPPPPPRVSTLQRKDKQNLENRENELKFLAFSTVNLKTLEKKTTDQPVRINKYEVAKEKNEISALTALERDETNLDVKKLQSGISNKKKRQTPSIVIQPKIVPKSVSNYHKKTVNKKARVNLQMMASGNSIYSPNSQLDSKGPSEKHKDQYTDIK